MNFVSHRALIIALALAGPVTVLASPAQAQTQVADSSAIADWENPGSFPFAGNFDDVCSLYAATLTDEQCARAIDQYEREQGTVMFLQDGDILQVSFTVGGVHKQKTLRVAFGADVPSDDPKRRALVFDTGRADGVKLVRPDVCGNWSVMTVLFEPAEPRVVERIIERVETRVETQYVPQVCVPPGATTINQPSVFLPGIGHPPGCECEAHLSSVWIDGGTLQTFGYGCVPAE